MFVREIPFLTDSQKAKLITVGITEIKGDNISNLKDFLSYGEAKRSQRLLMYLLHLGIKHESYMANGVDYFKVVDYSDIADNVNLKKKEEDSIIDTANKIKTQAAEKWDAIQKEAAQIEIDLTFIKDVADKLMFTGSATTTDPIIISSFNMLLRRNNIKTIRTNEKEVLHIVFKKTLNNWLYKIMTNQ